MKSTFLMLFFAMLLPLLSNAQTSTVRSKQMNTQNASNKGLSKAPATRSSYENRGKSDSTMIKDRMRNGEGKWKGADSTRVKGNGHGENRGKNGEHHGQKGGEEHHHDGKGGEHHDKDHHGEKEGKEKHDDNDEQQHQKKPAPAKAPRQ